MKVTVRFICVLFGLVSVSVNVLAANNISVDFISAVTADNDEVGIEAFRSNGNTIMLWLPYETGTQAIDRRLAKDLAVLGVEVWIVDLPAAYFLPTTTSSMERIPAVAISSVIENAQKTKKRIVLAGSGRTAIPLLRGLRDWQLNHPKSTDVIGTILISPKIFVKTPEPGDIGVLMPIIKATNILMVLLQPNRSPWYWKLNQIVPALEQGGSQVYIWPLKNVRDRFYFRPDAVEEENALRDELTDYFYQSINLLSKHPRMSYTAVNEIVDKPITETVLKDKRLTKYHGTAIHPEINLLDLDNRRINLSDYKGQVVAVNFWATWCPPCVHEMPSMQKLSEHFPKNKFIILGVNMAEDKATIQNFLDSKVKVSFPILLDTDGAALRAWRVFAFPTTYIIDKQGKIRYAVFGGIDWHSEDVVRKIQLLIDE